MRFLIRCCGLVLAVAGCDPGGSGTAARDDNDAAAAAGGPDTGPTVIDGGGEGSGDGGGEGSGDGGGEGSGDAGTDAGCTPDCAGRACGDDGCGDGRCARGEDCEVCAADCACAMGRVCNAGRCEVQACEGADCGAPPRILTFNVNTRRLTEGEEVTFSAVVTDPDGIGDLIGGVLEDQGGASYGAFSAAGEEGAYQLVVSWNAIHAVEPIELEGSAAREFVAAFFDQAGNRVTESLQITLHCDAAGGVACAGRCTDLNEPAHCGGCRAACEGACMNRQCACPEGQERCGGDACVDTGTDPAHCGACDNACAAPAGGAATCESGECGVRCAAGRTLCGGQCPECPSEHVAETACDGAACVAVECDPEATLCDGACSVCPSENVVQHGCVGRRCVATECRMGFQPCAEGCCPWRFADVAPAVDSFAFALDGDGRPHVLLGTRARISLASRDPDSGDWDDAVEVARIEGEVIAPPDVSLAFSGTTPYVGYSWFTPSPEEGVSAGELRFLRREGAAWVELGRRVDTGLDIPRGPTLATDDRGAVHACYENNRAWCSALTEFEPVQVSETRVRTPHLAFGGRVPHLTWQNFAGRSLGYAIRAAAWQPDTANHNAGTGLVPRVTVTADGPAMVHHTEGSELWWTRRVQGFWHSERILRDLVFRGDYDVATDARGEPVICLGTARGLLLLRRAGGRWQEEQVVAQATRSCRMVVTPQGVVHLIYVDTALETIRHAR